MAFTPPTKDELLEQMAGVLVVRSPLTDLSEGGTALGILGAVSEPLEAIGLRQKKFRDAFAFKGAVGTDLDERCADLPRGRITRLGPTAANGSGMVLTFIDAAVETVVSAGTVYSRSDDPTIQYIQTNTVTKPAGQASYPITGQTAIAVVASVLGTKGNAAKGMIDTKVSGSSNIQTVSNSAAVSGGLDREDDDSLKYRGELYLASLVGTQAPALEFMARSFVSSQGIRVRHASVYEDPTRPGYSELIVDNGDGFDGYRKLGLVAAGTIPENGALRLWHEMPAVDPITEAHFQINSAPAPLSAAGEVQWTSVEERGELYPEVGVVSPADTWEISGYEVYTGPLAELQRLVEGRASDVARTFGYRPSAGRVKVRPPDLIYQDFTLNIAVTAGADLATVQTAIEDEVTLYLQTVPPGEPVYLALLYARLVSAVDNLVNVTIAFPTADVYAFSPQVAIRAGTITVT